MKNLLLDRMDGWDLFINYMDMKNAWCRWVAEEDTIINFPTVRMKKKIPMWVKREVNDVIID